MDDADLRRGKPSVHKAFGEAEAVLAGDALTRWRSRSLLIPQRTKTLRPLGAGAGAGTGRACRDGGRADDGPRRRGTRARPSRNHAAAAAEDRALIEYAVEAACIMVKLPPEARTPYRGYARNIGLAFQIADDLIDHCGDEEAAGKRTGQDATPGRQPSFRSAARNARASRPTFSSARRSSICRTMAGRPICCAPSPASLSKGTTGWQLKIAVYPGTFDPITLGHIDIIRRGAHLVDKLVDRGRPPILPRSRCSRSRSGSRW